MEGNGPMKRRFVEDEEPSIPRQRRMQAACEVCKKRKIRCTSGPPGNPCKHCASSGLDCSHVDVMMTLTSENGYVSALESRVQKMERLLTRLLPGIDFTEQLEGQNVQPLLENHADTLPRNDGDLVDGLNKLKLNPETQRFFGKSSGIQFIQTVFDFQSHITGMDIAQIRRVLPALRRPAFWTPNSWMLPSDVDEPEYSFPEPDLLSHLMDNYWREYHPFWPILHRPTFERKVADNLHLRDRRFGGTLLLVCSLGARFSVDPRVLIDKTSDLLHSAGWKWHKQVDVIQKYLIYKPDLYELQTIALSALFLQGVSTAAVAWTQVGFGLRRAEDVGAHRRRKHEQPTAEIEQWKRVFWVLLCLEYMTGTHAGRPLAMRYQDFDQDQICDCDDEYWEVPEPNDFKQPKDKPSSLAYFIWYAKLLEIQATVTTTLYSPRKPKGLGASSLQHTDSQVITALDSALNGWVNGLPKHLRWDPACKNTLHFKQSALLHAAYYNVQILVHRPFIPAPFDHPAPSALPSLAICRTAARSCARIFETYEQRGIQPQFNLLPAAFSAGIVLLLSAWSNKKSNSTYNPSQELEQVNFCLRLATMAEKRFTTAGRYKDILSRLIFAGESIDRLFSEMRPVTHHLDRELAQCPASDPDDHWSAAFGVHHIADFEAATEHIDAEFIASPKPPLIPDASFGTSEQVSNTGSNTPLAAETAANEDVMAMWSTAPCGFHLDDWSYIMSSDMNPMNATGFDHFSFVPDETSQPYNGGYSSLDIASEVEKLQWELGRYF
ncbi:fungal-specific transcription factor domain-containing protein [Favolaschia claudopus]|uniref:Fungal-specific transcription factor domain-containing protein n=1 Tax=Favolaschia claudopus TaxID=2862362 RepID=A0AAW0A9K3_9AGAR